MIRIDPFLPSDIIDVVTFVEAIQEYERAAVPDLKLGSTIAQVYAELLVRTAAERNGCIFLAKADFRSIGFVCRGSAKTTTRCSKMRSERMATLATSMSSRIGERRE